MARVHVLGGDVAAPGTAAQAQGEGQTITWAASALVEVLVDQDPPRLGAQCQRIDVVVAAGVNPAGVPKALITSDCVDQINRMLDATVVAVQSEHDRELLA